VRNHQECLVGRFAPAFSGLVELPPNMVTEFFQIDPSSKACRELAG